MTSSNFLTLEELRHFSEIVKAVFRFEDYLSDRTAQLKLDSMPEKETSHKTVKSVLKNRVADCNENLDPYNDNDCQRSDREAGLGEDDTASKYMPPGACRSSRATNSSGMFDKKCMKYEMINSISTEQNEVSVFPPVWNFQHPAYKI